MSPNTSTDYISYIFNYDTSGTCYYNHNTDTGNWYTWTQTRLNWSDFNTDKHPYIFKKKNPLWDLLKIKDKLFKME